jgi:hypothetical protein
VDYDAIITRRLTPERAPESSDDSNSPQ